MDRWVVLHYNYIACYKLGKNKPDFVPKPEDEPDELVMLELNNEQVRSSLHPFDIPSPPPSSRICWSSEVFLLWTNIISKSTNPKHPRYEI